MKICSTALKKLKGSDSPFATPLLSLVAFVGTRFCGHSFGIFTSFTEKKKKSKKRKPSQNHRPFRKLAIKKLLFQSDKYMFWIHVLPRLCSGCKHCVTYHVINCSVLFIMMQINRIHFQAVLDILGVANPVKN